MITIDQFYGCITCTSNITSIQENQQWIRHDIISQYLFSQKLSELITYVKITACHSYLSGFKTRQAMETFCEEDHLITENITITFKPDYERTIKISVENIPIEFLDAKKTKYAIKLRQPYWQYPLPRTTI